MNGTEEEEEAEAEKQPPLSRLFLGTGRKELCV